MSGNIAILCQTKMLMKQFKVTNQVTEEFKKEQKLGIFVNHGQHIQIHKMQLSTQMGPTIIVETQMDLEKFGVSRAPE